MSQQKSLASFELPTKICRSLFSLLTKRELVSTNSSDNNGPGSSDNDGSSDDDRFSDDCGVSNPENQR
jgi:hypothetical protein